MCVSELCVRLKERELSFVGLMVLKVQIQDGAPLVWASGESSSSLQEHMVEEQLSSGSGSRGVG